MKGKLYLLSALLLLYSPIFSQQVSLETAQRVANIFLQNNVSSAMRSASATSTTTSNASVIKPIGKVAQSPVMYAVSQDSVWVLVSADERVAPILAYSDANAGMFPEEEDMPDGMIALLEWYEEQIQYLRDSTNITTIHEGWQTYQATSNTTENEIVVSPLLYRDGIENLWKQSGLNGGGATADKCYNKFCPLKNGQRTIVGCLAVAMGQLMWYWQWPEIAVVKDDDRNTLIREYDWDYMPAQLQSNTPIQHIDMVANLLHDAGVSINMSYGVTSSVAAYYQIAGSLRGTFGYNTSNMTDRISDNVEWLNMLKENLQKGYPVLYSGSEPGQNVGHQFLLDGYNSSDMFHINYGWGTGWNGYFMLDTMNGVPYTQYLSSQRAHFDVSPNYPNCSSREVLQEEMQNTTFVIQNGGGLTIGEDVVVEAYQEGVIYSREYVKLTNGFHAKAGCNLRIAIKDVQCNESQSASLIQKKVTSETPAKDWCNQWNIVSHSYRPGQPLYGACTMIYRMEGDTTINQQVYTKLVCTYTNHSATEKWYISALRFTEDKKVYIYYDNTEYLLYDFDVQIGDTLDVFAGIDYYDFHKTYPHVVTNVNKLDDGRLQFYLDAIVRDEYLNQEEKFPKTWIEGVGSVDGIIHNNAIIGVGGNGKTALLCAYHNDECRYVTDNPNYTPLGCVYNEGDVINAVEHLSVSTPSVQKIIKDGQLLIIRDEKTYNVMGMEVK